MEYVIGLILLIIVVIIVGLLLRKRLYDSVDYYESWKLDIMNRNVALELSKVKELNLEGDTKEHFEEWKDQWDSILTEELADVEELLYDTEHAADRYNFPAAKKSLNKIEETLVKIEKKIEGILSELNVLLETEAENRKEIAELEPLLHELRKELSHNRFKYDRAEIRFEVEFDEIDHEFKNYSELVEEGNYIQAKDIVANVKKRLEELQTEMEEFPSLYKKSKQELPSQLDDLSRGLREMKDEGYFIDHLDFAREINEYQSRLLDIVASLQKEGTEEAKKALPEMEDRIAEMYELLEKEAIAKNFVETKMPNYEKGLDNLETHFLNTKLEVEQLRETYYFEDSDLEKYMSLEKMVTQLKGKLVEFTTKVEANNYAHSKLRAELEEAFQQLDIIEEEHEQFKQRIQTLRKEEIEAREQLKTIHDTLFKTTRKLRTSNLPGVPDYIWTMMEDASAKSDRVLEALDEQPLDIQRVQKNLSEAQSSVETAIDQTNTMLDHASLTEQVIQYANRYRSTNQSLAQKLAEAERLFRKAEYEHALETAANAIEEVEPGALNRIEKQQEMIVS
ncbi:septation ring formation regulator EzrA [Pseudogracilibacillus sp. SE30717A]|uniref:septation ring formation regulator EzrA n=1 Tax=Pseudogracilibacillus sp. SE30717A TaxID=3098293 RepID=UPI00300E3DA3